MFADGSLRYLKYIEPWKVTVPLFNHKKPLSDAIVWSRSKKIVQLGKVYIVSQMVDKMYHYRMYLYEKFATSA